MAKKMDKNTFDLVKMLVASGATNTTIASHLGLSAVTVSRIRGAESLDAYVAKVTDSNAKSKAKRAPAPACDIAPAPAPIPRTDAPTSYQTGRMIELLSKQNELLTLISNKLAYIVEQLA